jgi:hypothetical protein
MIAAAVKHLAAWQVTASLSVRRISAGKSEASKSIRCAGVLLTTAVGAATLSLEFVGTVLQYDNPASVAGMAQRQGRYDRIGRTEPCIAYFFRDRGGHYQRIVF